MNIMHVVLSLEYGGLEKVVIDLASHLNNGKYKVVICCLDRLGDLAKEAENRGIKVIFVKRKPGIDILLPFRLSKIFKDEKIDIVHTHNHAAMLYGTLGAKLTGIHKIFNTIHGREKKIKNACIWSMIWQMNSRIITISQDAKKELVKNSGINPGKIDVIYNGIDISRFKKSDVDSNIIGTVSRLSLEKDNFTMLEAFKIVTSRIDNVKLTIAGDGPLRESLKFKVESLKLEGKVQFMGFRNDIPEILSRFNVFALSSLTEGISISLLEAMASSKPVVATNVGGNPEVVVDGETGILVPPKEPERIAEAIIKILSDRDMAKRMGEAGRKTVEEKFSLERMVKEYQEIYEGQ
jgi:sugar transferase (PEP-CTERM/EpsH1 system associated)